MAGSVTKLLGHQQERKPHVLRGFWRGKHVRQTAARRGTGRCVEPQFALAATTTRTSLLNVKTIVWYGVSVKGVAGEQGVCGRMAERDARHVPASANHCQSRARLLAGLCSGQVRYDIVASFRQS
jgi:hypothetical protein